MWRCFSGSQSSLFPANFGLVGLILERRRLIAEDGHLLGRGMPGQCWQAHRQSLHLLFRHVDVPLQ
jgi:hypothetical protein